MDMLSVLLFTLTLVVAMVTAQTDNPCKPEGESGYEIFISAVEGSAEGTELYELKIPGNSSEVSLSSEYNEYFALNTTSRSIIVNGTLDAEVSADQLQETLVIDCRVLAEANTFRISVYIRIIDANDNGPEFQKDVYTLTVSELLEVQTIIPTYITAYDKDALTPNNLIYFDILPGPYSDYFLIPDRLTPDVILLKPLDFESLKQLNITVIAEDQPRSGEKLNDTCLVIFNVEDKDDQYPVFNSSVYQAYITDTNALGSVVQVDPPIAAYDPDVTLNAKVLYSFHGESTSLLAIDQNTAQITLTGTPTSKEVYLLLQATQDDNPSRYGVALLAVQVQGSNVNAPEFIRVSDEVIRTEAFPVGEVIATMIATDADPGSLITYSLDEASKGSFSLNSATGDITLNTALSYKDKPQHVIKVTASDGTLQSTAQLTLVVSAVNNKPPVILNQNLNVSMSRTTGALVIDIDAEDNDEGVTVLSYRLLTHTDLFIIDANGRVLVSAAEDDLKQEVYQIAVTVSDDGQPSYTAAAAVTVNFPKLEAPVAAASMAESDDLIVIVLAAVMALLIVLVIILTVYICRQRSRDKEHLDRAKRQPPSMDAKALGYTQRGTLGRQNKVSIQFEEPSDGDTTIQENPLSSATKGGYYNFGRQNSDTDIEVDMNEIQVETSVTPFHGMPVNHVNDDNNNDNIYNNSQLSEESDYAPSDKQAITSFFRNGSLSTYRDSSGSETSINTSPTDSHDSKKNLMVAPGNLARTRVPEEDIPNGHGMAMMNELPNLDPDNSVVPASQKQELTVYF